MKMEEKIGIESLIHFTTTNVVTTVKIPKQKYNNLQSASNGNIPYDETEMAFFLNMLNEDLISSTLQSSVKTTE